MQRFLIDAVDGSEVAFSDAQVHQIRHVLRLRPGDRVRVFDGRQPLDSLVEWTGAHGRVLEQCPQAPEPRTRLVAYPALLQRDKFETVLQKLTELGAHEIVPLLTERCQVRTSPDPPRLERWQAIVREATEQCGRGHVPHLGATVRFAQAVEQAAGAVLLAYEGECDFDVRRALADRPTTVSVLVGPEGGFSADEIARARTAQARLVSLGPRILRAETASPVFAALVLYELGDLSSA